MSKRPSDDYWDKYTNLQAFKHELLRRYLNAWFPILANRSKRILYVETHAGKGRHAGGQAGSPIVALTTLLEHSHIAQILESTEVEFTFMEEKGEDAELLRKEVRSFGELPKGVRVRIVDQDYQVKLTDQLNEMRQSGERSSPAFVFVDPFSFMFNSTLLADFMTQDRCEILLNFMWENMRQALANPAHRTNMTELFGEGNWEDLPNISDEKSRCDEAIERLRIRLGTPYSRLLRFYGFSRSIKYVLAHFTKSDVGFEKMNEAMWAIDPCGTFSVSAREDPRKDWIFEPKATLEPLKLALTRQFSGKTVRYERLWRVAREVYLKTHCRQAVLELLQEGECQLPAASRLIVKTNPLIRFN
ncbi:MAG: three-Cys-motif partner protein TcmP [Planctomycetes bacterium]|nr:three-Cys-motif partner protein TcmP [Planctomycetota bacterium]